MDHFRDLTKKGFFKGGISFLLGRGVGALPPHGKIGTLSIIMHHLDLKSGHFLDLVHMLSGVRFLQFLSQAHLGFAAALASSSPLFVGWSSMS